MAQEIQRREFLKCLVTSGIVLSSTGSIGALLSGCERGKEVNVETVYDFLDHLDEATVVTPEESFVKRSSFTIQGEEKGVLFEHPDSHVTFENIPIHGNARLEFGIGINEAAWAKPGDGVLFQIVLSDERSKKHLLYSRYIDPKNDPEDRKWLDEVVALREFDGKTVSITFKTSSGPKGNNASDWAGWSEPRIDHSRSIIVKNGKSDHVNVVLIVVDTLRADHLGCYGNKIVKTPAIDQIASGGVLFENHFSQSSITNPSHASILTSLYSKNHGVYNNRTRLDGSSSTLAEILKANGYRTAAAVSAFHLNGEYSGFGQGFDDFYDVTPLAEPKKDTFVFLTKRAGATNQKVFHWLEQNLNKKFFMFIHYFDPHNPYSPPEPFNKMYYNGDPTNPLHRSMENVTYAKHLPNPPKWLEGITDVEYVNAQYKGEVSYTDSEIGKLMDYLKKLNLEENTMIIVTSDHGENLGEHEMYFDHWGLHETVLKVPLIIKHPPVFPSNKRIKSLSMNIDILPTVLESLSIGFDSTRFDGRSLHAATKQKESYTEKRMVYSEHMNRIAVSARNNKWAVIRDLLTRVYSSKYRFVEGKVELYDLESDPHELEDVAQTYPDTARRLGEQLAGWLEDKRPQAKPAEKPEVSTEIKEKLKALGYVQ